MSPRDEEDIDTLLSGVAPKRLVERAQSAEPIEAGYRAKQGGRSVRRFRWRADPESRGLLRSIPRIVLKTMGIMAVLTLGLGAIFVPFVRDPIALAVPFAIPAAIMTGFAGVVRALNSTDLRLGDGRLRVRHGPVSGSVVSRGDEFEVSLAEIQGVSVCWGKLDPNVEYAGVRVSTSERSYTLITDDPEADLFLAASIAAAAEVVLREEGREGETTLPPVRLRGGEWLPPRLRAPSRVRVADDERAPPEATAEPVVRASSDEREA